MEKEDEMSNWRRRWVLRRFVPTLAVMTIAVPTASASPLEPASVGSGSAKVSGSQGSSHAGYDAIEQARADLVREQTPIVAKGSHAGYDAIEQARADLVRDQRPVVATDPKGFDWPGSEIALAAFAALLAASGVAMKRYRSRPAEL